MLGDLLGALTGDQGNSSGQPSAGQDPLSSLLGGLLGGQSGGGQGGMSQALGGLLGGGQSNRLGNVLGVLEGVMNANAPASVAGQSLQANQGGNVAANDPTMQMLTPVVDGLAAKMNISPQIAMLVVTFVVHQLLSSHPASGRTSMIDPGALQQQVNSGQGVSHAYLQSSGLVNQLVQQTGLDPQTATKSLKTVFDMLGQG
ncbi:MAG: hypothetical protein WA821_16350 [Anaerolineales bacterium]